MEENRGVDSKIISKRYADFEANGSRKIYLVLRYISLRRGW